ncbi:hypothetical protein FRC07_001649 [Ceratobasidium sp. 392]|nr:hypothetical protein FRC07_001649 [Ceratobasidium sp. 392]
MVMVLSVWLPACYWAVFQNIAPAPLIALEKDGSQDIYIAPDAAEFINLLGTAYTSYYDAKGFNYKKYAGAKVLTIDGTTAWSYVNKVATTYSGNYIDHNIRVNSVFTNYRISSGAWSQRLGDFAGPIFPDKDSVTLTLIPANSTKVENVTIEYRASYLGAPFIDSPSFWQANCVADEYTNGIDYRDTSAAVKRDMLEKKRRPIAKVSSSPAKGVGLPTPYQPTQPDIINGTGVIKAYVLPDKKTGVLMVGSFGGDYVGFQNDTIAALAKFKTANVQQLIIDTTGNGGGYVCLGEFLINALAGTKFGYSGFESTMRAGPLARKIVASDIAQGIDYMFYSPNQWAFLNNTPQPANYNYMEPPTSFVINGSKDAVSKRFYDICTPYDVVLPPEPFLPASKIIIVGNGECASTCALFTAEAYEKLGVKVATFGGNPGQAMNFNGMAGNQVLEWADLDSEIKTAGLKNNKAEPLAFHVERANYRIPYTVETYNSPQNLWTYVAKTYLNMVVSSIPFFASFGAFAFARLAAANGGSKSALDPCAVIAGQAFSKPSEARACLKSFPFNPTLAKNVLEVVTRVTPFFTFEDWQKHTPAPFTEASSNLDEEFARIKATKYKTDYDFNRDVYNVINHLDDGHTLWLPACYWAAFQNIAPAPLTALEKDGSQDIYIAPDAGEFIDLLGTGYTSYYTAKGFDYKKYAGAKVLEIDGVPARKYVNGIATNYSGNYIDHNVRVNSVFTSYLVSGGAWSQRLGDFAGPLFPDKDSVTMKLIPTNCSSDKAETVKIEYRAAYLGAPFTGGPSYWKANCLANQFTNGVDYRNSSGSVKRALLEKKRRPIAKVSAAPVKGVGLPGPYQPTQPELIKSRVSDLKAYILPATIDITPDKKTGVLMVGSFGGDYVGFQNDTVAALAKFKAAKVQQLIVDVTGNGGGYICLGLFLINALAGTNFGYPGFESAMRAGPLARKIVASDIAQGINYMFYSPNQWAFLNNTPQPANYNYMEPPTTFRINGVKDTVSKRIHDICTPYNVALPTEKFLPASKIIIVGNGECASTCALFTAEAYEKLGIKVATFGGNPGQPMNFNGLAGNQVLEWPDLDSEIKTAGLKNCTLAPPDLLVNANYRVNWRYAYSWQNKSDPLAFHVERSNYRAPYTAETYNSPQNLWTYVANNYLKDKETRELLAKELALYETKEELGASTSRTLKVKQEELETERLLTQSARASLEQRVMDLEKIVAKQEAKIKSQGQDLTRLWELMEGEISGHHGALGVLLSSQPDYKLSGGEEDEEDSDKSEERRRDRPIQTAEKGRAVQTARRSRPWRARGGRHS